MPLHLQCAAHGQSGFDNNQLGYIGFPGLLADAAGRAAPATHDAGESLASAMFEEALSQ